MKIDFWRFQGGWSVVINGKVTEGVHFFETVARVKALCFRLGLLTPKFPKPCWFVIDGIRIRLVEA